MSEPNTMNIESIPNVITNLCDALNAVGINSSIGACIWSDGDAGYVIHAGDNTDKLIGEVDGKWVEVGETKISLFSMSFRSDGTLWDYEDKSVYKTYNQKDK